MSKETKILLAIIIVLVIAVSVLLTMVVMNKVNTNNSNEPIAQIEPTMQTPQTPKTTISESDKLTIVPTLQDTISSDSAWCGTFQLIWNDMKNEVVKNDVIFSPQEQMATNLNKGEFDESMISDEYYYKTYGYKTLELKEKIEKEIQKKFNQTSDILNDFDWSDSAIDNQNNNRRYFFYTMLYRQFKYKSKFDKLENGTFGGDKYKNVNYFGINTSTSKNVRKQINVLYYNSRDDFAVRINTKEDDEVIFCKSPEGSNFSEIYQNMNKKKDSFTGNKTFGEDDEFRAPYLDFNEKREYTELENKPFKTANPVYPTAEIAKAIQSIKFTLGEKGGEIKSEAAIEMEGDIAVITEPEEKQRRYFYVDDTFALFLREKNKKNPYFAGKIEDITKFQ